MSYKTVRKELAEKMRETSGGNLPCIICSRPTPWVTLHNHGARCMSCYAYFCRDGPVIRIAEKALPRKPAEPKQAEYVGPEHITTFIEPTA